MKSWSQIKHGVATSFRTDPNVSRARSWAGRVSRRLPSATAEYLAEKLPVVQWLPHYNPQWLLGDLIAGVTVGVMLIPQGLAYAKIATVPIENGLYASWLPPLLYFFLGTSRELSAGPTSVLGLLTAEAVDDLSRQGYRPAAVSAAMAFVVGAYALAMGLLKLGFLLDFVSAPVLTGWISAVAIVIALDQVGSLVGLDLPPDVAGAVHDLFARVRGMKPPTLAMGLTGVAFLLTMERAGKRYGGNKYVRFACTSRAVLLLIVHTLISYLCNRGRGEKLLWAVTEVDTHGLPDPRPHDPALLKAVSARAFAPLVAMSVEHLGVGKAFALRGGYTVDKSQELVFLGVNNMVNSLFGAQTTGGAMSRTAVNSDCDVRSPVNFLFTGGLIVLTLFELAPALYWIPKATLAAIIIMAVARLVARPSQFYRFWRMSFVDFVGSQLGLWVTLFTSTEVGLATAVGFSIVYTLLRLAFPRWVGLSRRETETGTEPGTETDDGHTSPCLLPAAAEPCGVDVPAGAYLVRYTGDIVFPNAERVKAAIIQAVKVRSDPASAPDAGPPGAGGSRPTWNPAGRKQIVRIRKRRGITAFGGDETPLRRVVLDFGRVSFIDATGVFSVTELKMELRRYIGRELEFRFVGMTGPVRERFDRSGWEFASPGEQQQQQRAGTADAVYSSVETALWHLGKSADGDEALAEKTADP
ncbi:sulfate permease [Metarhizium album ARSEF 1941]|uniref:Sulfate permease n=1 Tax=Metarhizium album (strain ARSEF 1941) TaxID=1081103 RepID=A0A0B2WMF7_METAS|nr:sulfate permease [Metarhizium album ARSEF 1941]KHN94672.1 sulfate permease [Metarhizium album ARSEF 1941]